MEWSIIKRFSTQNRTCFCFQDVIAEFPDRDPSYLAKLLARMVKNGRLIKINRDIYHTIPFEADPETYSPDSRLIAKYLMKGRDYYIGYSSAMRIHGFSDFAEPRTIIVSNTKIHPSRQKIAGSEFQFVHHSFRKFFGQEDAWVTSLEKVKISNLEKTIADGLSKPTLCGGIMEVRKIIFWTNKRINMDKLFFNLSVNHSNAAKKRYLLLYRELGLKWTSDHDRLLQETGSSISLLDPAAPNQGRQDTHIGLRINIDPVALKDHRNLQKYRIPPMQ